MIGGRSPFNELTFRQARALEARAAGRRPALPVYVGMRNWTPVRTGDAAAHGGGRCAARCRDHHGAAADRCELGTLRACGVGGARARSVPRAPEIDYVDEWHAHPLFIEAVSDNVARGAGSRFPPNAERRPRSCSPHTACPRRWRPRRRTSQQITDSARLVADAIGHSSWSIAYQSRSGNPREPWLEPDICEVLRQLGREHVRDVVVAPIGFVCDHVEVLYDLDIEARQVAEEARAQLRARRDGERSPGVHSHAGGRRAAAHAASRVSR